jgi:hypothetical protein
MISGQIGREMHRGFIWRNLKECEHFTDLDVEARTILEWILEKESSFEQANKTCCCIK